MIKHIKYIIPLILVIVLSTPVAALTGFQYSIGIDIDNNGNATKQRILFNINANNLVTGGYLQADGVDARLSAGGVDTQNLNANSLANTTATWVADWMSLGAGGSERITVHCGNANTTLDQIWISNANDTYSITDNDSLDITGGLTIEADVYIENMPSGNVSILQKDNSYELLLSNGTYSFSYYETSIGDLKIANITPSAVGNRTELTPQGEASNYLCVDDPPASPDSNTTYVWNDTGVQWDFYEMSNLTDAVQIVGITANYLINCIAPATMRLDPGVYTNGEHHNGTYKSTTDTAYIPYSVNWATNPATSVAWTPAEINNIEMGQSYRRTAGAPGTGRVTQMYANVTYYELSGTNATRHTVTATATAGVWQNVRCTYDNTDLKIYVNDVEIDTEATSANIQTNTNNLTSMLFDGKIDDLLIGNNSIITPIYVGNFTFEPDTITSNNTISDQSAFSNNITYTLEANEYLTITVRPMTVGDKAEASGDYTTAATGFAGSAPSQPGDLYGNTSASWEALPGSELVGVLAEEGNVPVSFLWYVIIGISLLAVSFFVYQYSHNSLVVAIAGIVGLTFCAMVFPIGWWMMIVYVLWAWTIVMIEKQVSI